MRFLLIIGSCIMIFIGAISVFLPIPGAVLILAFGLASLIYNSDSAANYIRMTRTKSSRLNNSIVWVENKVGGKFGKTLQKTRPFE